MPPKAIRTASTSSSSTSSLSRSHPTKSLTNKRNSKYVVSDSLLTVSGGILALLSSDDEKDESDIDHDDSVDNTNSQRLQKSYSNTNKQTNNLNHQNSATKNASLRRETHIQQHIEKSSSLSRKNNNNNDMNDTCNNTSMMNSYCAKENMIHTSKNRNEIHHRVITSSIATLKLNDSSTNSTDDGEHDDSDDDEQADVTDVHSNDSTVEDDEEVEEELLDTEDELTSDNELDTITDDLDDIDIESENNDDVEDGNEDDEEDDYESDYDPNNDSDAIASIDSHNSDDSEDELSFDPDADEIRPAKLLLQQQQQQESQQLEQQESIMTTTTKKLPSSTKNKRSNVKSTKPTSMDKTLNGRNNNKSHNSHTLSTTTSQQVSNESHVTAKKKVIATLDITITDTVAIDNITNDKTSTSDESIVILTADSDTDDENENSEEYDEVMAEIIPDDNDDNINNIHIDEGKNSDNDNNMNTFSSSSSTGSSICSIGQDDDLHNTNCRTIPLENDHITSPSNIDVSILSNENEEKEIDNGTKTRTTTTIMPYDIHVASNVDNTTQKTLPNNEHDDDAVSISSVKEIEYIDETVTPIKKNSLPVNSSSIKSLQMEKDSIVPMDIINKEQPNCSMTPEPAGTNNKTLEDENLDVNIVVPEPNHDEQLVRQETNTNDVPTKAVPVPNIKRSSTFRRDGGSSIQRGQWKLGSKIGVGAFGVVHVGMNTITGTLMAVKSIKMEPSNMKDTEQEIQLLQTLHHINIVRYLGSERDTKYLHIFQEWVPAGSVTNMLSKFGPFPLSVIQNYLLQILHGLQYLHNNNIMHRDIKGSNILVNDDGIVKLADFGASKRFVQLKQDMMMSLTMRGTPYFMAPEVFEERYSTKADIWSVGCVAVQMITGNPPWKDLGLSNPVSLFQHITKTSGPPKMKINETESIYGLHNGQSTMELFRDLINVCFDRIPENRPSSSDLLLYTFFTDEHSFSIDDVTDNVCGLFNSPVSAMKHTISSSPVWANNLSPIHSIPIRRCNSIGAGIARSPMMSPPLPKRNVDSRNVLQLRMEHSPTLASLSSPIPNQTEWPTWAKNKLQTEPSIKDEGHHNNRNVSIIATPLDRRSVSTVDSLAYSDDENNSNVSNTMQGDYRKSVSIPHLDEVSIFSPPLIGVDIINSNTNDV